MPIDSTNETSQFRRLENKHRSLCDVVHFAGCALVIESLDRFGSTGQAEDVKRQATVVQIRIKPPPLSSLIRCSEIGRHTEACVPLVSWRYLALSGSQCNSHAVTSLHSWISILLTVIGSRRPDDSHMSKLVIRSERSVGKSQPGEDAWFRRYKGVT